MTACYCALLRNATRKVTALYDEALAPFGINIAQYALMRSIERRQPVSLSALGQVQGLDRSTVGRNVQVLARLGLVETSRGADDRREAVVTLADKGAQVLQAAAPAWELCQRRIETRLGPDTAGALRVILGTL
ncbi:MarR family transcriptional regulator [bacterium]|nr:MarR family transcriptional regulator [bacterium]